MLMGLISSALIVLSLWLLSGLPDLAQAPWQRWLFLGCALAMSPLHSGLGQINISMMAIAFVFLSFWAASTGRPFAAGIFCAISGCLKPPIGLFLALFYLFSRQFRAFAITAGDGDSARGCSDRTPRVGRRAVAFGLPCQYPARPHRPNQRHYSSKPQ